MLYQLHEEISTILYFREVAFVKPLTVEEKIEKELGAEFIAIAYCESRIRQFNDDGSVLISSTSDVGLLQINQVHWDRAIELGIDIYTVDGNIEFAKLLKEGRGTGDWYKSKSCWQPRLAMVR